MPWRTALPTTPKTAARTTPETTSHTDSGGRPTEQDSGPPTTGQPQTSQLRESYTTGTRTTTDQGTDTLTAFRWLLQEWPRHTIEEQASAPNGRRTRIRTDRSRGRYISAGLPTAKEQQHWTPEKVALDATLRASASHSQSKPDIKDTDLRIKRRETKAGNTILFAVDASASAGANHRMRVTKSLILALLKDAYQKRDRVGLIAFRGDHAEVLLPFTRSVELANRRLQDLPTGGRTPLAEGLALARDLLEKEVRRQPACLPVLVLVTDGRANYGKDALRRALTAADTLAASDLHTVVLDTEQGPRKLGLAQTLATHLNARCLPLDAMPVE